MINEATKKESQDIFLNNLLQRDRETLHRYLESMCNPKRELVSEHDDRIYVFDSSRFRIFQTTDRDDGSTIEILYYKMNDGKWKTVKISKFKVKYKTEIK